MGLVWHMRVELFTAMTEKERYCSIHIAPLVNEMNIERFETVGLNGCFEIGKLVDLSFLFPPVVFMLPVCC